jgi:hypothetical protein
MRVGEQGAERRAGRRGRRGHCSSTTPTSTTAWIETNLIPVLTGPQRSAAMSAHPPTVRKVALQGISPGAVR